MSLTKRSGPGRGARCGRLSSSPPQLRTTVDAGAGSPRAAVAAAADRQHPQRPADPRRHPRQACRGWARGTSTLDRHGRFEVRIRGLVIAGTNNPGPVTTITVSLYCAPDSSAAVLARDFVIALVARRRAGPAARDGSVTVSGTRRAGAPERRRRRLHHGDRFRELGGKADELVLDPDELVPLHARTASASSEASGRGAWATSRRVRASRCLNEPSNGPCLRTGSKRRPREGQVEASGQSPQRRDAGDADRRAEVHQRLGAGRGRTRAPVRSWTRRTFTSTGSTGAAEGEAARPRRRCTARRPGSSVRSSGQPSLGDDPRRPLQVERAAVVAEPLPLADHVGRAARRRAPRAVGQRSSQRERSAARRARPASAAASPRETRIAYGSSRLPPGRSRPSVPVEPRQEQPLHAGQRKRFAGCGKATSRFSLRADAAGARTGRKLRRDERFRDGAGLRGAAAAARPGRGGRRGGPLPRLRRPVRARAVRRGCPAGVDVPRFIAQIARRPARRRGRSSPRTSSAGPAPASARSRCCARAPASSPTAAQADRDRARFSATRRSGA